MHQYEGNRRNQSPQYKKIHGQGPFRLPVFSTFAGTSILRSKGLSQIPQTLANSPGHLSLSRQRKVQEYHVALRLLEPLSKTRLEYIGCRKVEHNAVRVLSSSIFPEPRVFALCSTFPADRQLAPQGGGPGPLFLVPASSAALTCSNRLSQKGYANPTLS